MEALPDPAASYQPQSLLRRWHLCQLLVRHFWQRWSSEYLSHLMKLTKWKYPSRNLQNGDLVCLHEDKFSPTVWPMGRIVDTHQGRDGLVRVVTVKTSKGEYKRPVNKVALILPAKESLRLGRRDVRLSILLCTHPFNDPLIDFAVLLKNNKTWCLASVLRLNRGETPTITNTKAGVLGQSSCLM